MQWDSEVLTTGAAVHACMSRACPSSAGGLCSVLCSGGMSAWQEGFPQQFLLLLSNMLCFDGDTRMCALTGVSENTGLTSGAGNSEEFSLCYLRSGKSILSENA